MTMLSPLISANVRRTARRSAPWKSRLTGCPVYLGALGPICVVCGVGVGVAGGGVCAGGGAAACAGAGGGGAQTAGGAGACAIFATGCGAADLVGPASVARAFACGDGAAVSSMTIVSDWPSSDGSMWYAERRDISIATRVSMALLSLIPMRTF